MNQPSKNHKVRDYRETPFAYQDKPALRYIRQEWIEKRISDDAYRNLRNVYCALTEIASNKASQTIEASNRTMLLYCGLKDWRTIKKCLDMLEAWAFIAITKVRGADAKFRPRSITLLSVLHLMQDGRRSARYADRQHTQTAPDGEDREVKGSKESKENYKEINGANLKKINDMKAELAAKMRMNGKRPTDRN
ncbi:MAG TPA: hypothetical protein VG621_03615 [Candidatus Paceibacterota bacterium]|nr:hypothetical protein [Candidatus Paceibacterota bacterium]